MGNIEVNLNNLTDDEKEQLRMLVCKSNEGNEIWQPEYDEEYWCIDTDGYIGHCIDKGGNLDRGRYELGNFFKTRKEAELALKEQKVTVELQRFAEKYNEETAWYDKGHPKYYIDYDYGCEKIVILSTKALIKRGVYFTSKEVAKQAIKTIGKDKIKKYYLGVKNNG